MDIATTAGEASPEPLTGSGTGLARLAIGLLQGLYLYLLYRAAQDYSWPATDARLFAPLLLVGLLFPLILVASLGHMHFNRVSNWAGAVAAIAAALGAYDAWRVTDAAAPAFGQPAGAHPAVVMPSPSLCFALIAGVFIAHSLVMAGARERRWIASYPAYFDTAWKNAVQLAFSGLFVGAMWLVLFLGAHLFQLVKLDFPWELIRKPWFAIPASAFAFSCALHLTDVRPAIVRGIRALLLVLMSWLLPVMTLLVGAFLLSLPFTGLASLWATRQAAAVLLSAAGVFVVLVNAAWQDGNAPVVPAIRLSMRAACLLLVPLTAIAAYALGLRVADHGWTVDRIIAAACLVVAGCYSLGYAAAALRGSRAALVSRVNIATAFVVLATLLLLFSPVADPARLSVNSQLARLSSGKVTAAKFDFAYLRFDGVRYGRDALARLEATAAGPEAALVRGRIAAARKLERPWQARETEAMPADIAANLHLWPRGTPLPATFLHTDWAALPHRPLYPDCLNQAGKSCDAFLLDLSGDGKAEMIVIGTGPMEGAAVLGQDAHGTWSAIGTLPFYFAGCASVRKSLMAGDFRAVHPLLRDLEVAGKRIHVDERYGVTSECPRP